jgi:hypothetical protein
METEMSSMKEWLVNFEGDIIFVVYMLLLSITELYYRMFPNRRKVRWPYEDEY